MKVITILLVQDFALVFLPIMAHLKGVLLKEISDIQILRFFNNRLPELVYIDMGSSCNMIMVFPSKN